jgi:hypothetical protein
METGSSDVNDVLRCTKRVHVLFHAGVLVRVGQFVGETVVPGGYATGWHANGCVWLEATLMLQRGRRLLRGAADFAGVVVASSVAERSRR